ncbi:potassium transport system protein kup [Acrasis kona]|uniref:Potassium transport system protein kup n=1 Tax=Acrasis kona TaxID=1008807 RepID=A0AAW2YYX0_9EUKA
MADTTQVGLIADTENIEPITLARNKSMSPTLIRSKSAVSMAGSEINDDDVDIEIEKSVMDHHNHAHDSSKKNRAFLLMALTCVGVVYGDLATSPLYTFSAIFEQEPTEIDNLGALCMIIYSVIGIVSIKYAGMIIQLDNDGEGGILALTALIPDWKWEESRFKYIVKEACAFMSLIGAAFVLGDSAITPPISVLSAIEGLGSVLGDNAQNITVVATVVILIALFGFQRFGTAKVGLLFGPIMFLWCLCIAAIGIYNISTNAGSFKAFNPYYIVLLFQERGTKAIRMFAGVVLALTGCEAMYADLGHFGKGPIRLSWLVIVQPSVILCYMGQSSHLLSNPKNWESAFYNSTPSPIYWPIVVLATLSTIIASQAMITGAFSLISQASQLDYFPRLKIYHTSLQHEGQIYIPAVNYALLAGCILLTVLFKTSAALADAFGLAVCGVLLVTMLLYVVAVAVKWNVHWGLRALFLVPFTLAYLPLLTFFFSANLVKFFTGGWIPLVIGFVCFGVMLIWRNGLTRFKQLTGQDNVMRFDEFAEKTAHITRVKGLGVFYSHSKHGVPTYIRKHVQLCSVLPERMVFLTVKSFKVPFVKEELRATIRVLSHNMYLITARYGFMETADMNVPEVVRRANEILLESLEVDPQPDQQEEEEQRGTYHSRRRASLDYSSPLSNEQIIIEHQSKIFEDLGLIQLGNDGNPVIYYVPGYHLKTNKSKWFWNRYPLNLFIFMHKNSYSQISGLQIPVENTVELGTVNQL